MSRETRTNQSFRDWLTGVIVLVTTIVCLYSFAKISLWAVVAVSAIFLIGMLVLSAVLGARQRRRR